MTIAAAALTACIAVACSSNSGSSSTPPSSTVVSTSSKAATSTTGSTTTAPTRTILHAAGGVVIDAPSAAGARIVKEESIEDGVATGQVVTIGSTVGRFSDATLEITFPRRGSEANDVLARDRIAYFDDAIGRWIPLTTRLTKSSLTATSPIAQGTYGLVSLNDPRLWSVPTPPSTPSCAPAPDWIREVFVPLAARNTANCVEQISGGVRIHLANQTDSVLAYDIDPVPQAVHLQVLPGTYWALRELLAKRTTAGRVVVPPGGLAAVDVAQPTDPSGLIAFTGAYSLELGAVGFLADVLALAHDPDRVVDVLVAPAGDAPLAERLIACTSTDAGLAALGNYFAPQLAGRFTDCLVSAVDAAIGTLRGLDSLDIAHRRLSASDPSAASRLQGLIAYRELVRAVTPSLLLRSRLLEVPGPVIAWGPAPKTTIVRGGGIAQLFGVPLGIDADIALARLTAVLGPATRDDGWRDGCPFGGPSTQRYVAWDRFAALFSRTDAGDYFDSWRYQPPPAGESADERVVFPNGVRFGMTMAEVSERLGLNTSYWNVFDHLSVFDHDQRQYLGSGEDPAATIFDWYAEPSLPYCE